MAKPLRFRRDTRRWSLDRVESSLLADLDANLGATISTPWYRQPPGWSARRFDMDNGDTALFAWRDDDALWIGNTETPEALWRTEKYTFSEVPEDVAAWAERELLAELYEAEPWLEAYPTLARFFLPVLASKDGRESTRSFFRDHAAGFPTVSRDRALTYYETFLQTGVLDPYRHVMAGKLGTSPIVDTTRMAAAMAEFTVAKLLTDADYDITPEIEVTTGHSLDFRAVRGDDGTLVEVTRPLPPADRSADSPVAAVRETAGSKSGGQLSEHGGGATLFVDCSSFPDDAWAAVLDAEPSVSHRPAMVFRVVPDDGVEGYTVGSVPLDVESILDPVPA
ncbi:MAG: DUF5784 family protein [Halobacteriaceae archaeon]